MGMGNKPCLKIEEKWLLSIINMFTYIEGRTRLQKIGLISFFEELQDEAFFDDWRPYKYGGYSRRLAASLAHMEESGHIRSDEVLTVQDSVCRYSLTELGRQEIGDFSRMNASKINDLRQTISYYQSLPLKELLNAVYQKYPHLTKNSEIIADVNKTTDLNLHSVYEPTDPPRSGPSEMIPASPPADRHVFGDLDFREELAKSIGLEGVPDLDPRSFDRIKGLWSKRMGAEPFDAVEAIREVRSW